MNKIRIIGDSMEPVIKKNDLIEVEDNINPKDFKIGDILVWRLQNKHIADYEVHRAVWKRNVNGSLTFFCKGDLYPRSIAAIKEKHVVGRVKKIIRNGKTTEIRKGFWIIANLILTALSLFQGAVYYSYDYIIKKLHLSHL